MAAYINRTVALGDSIIAHRIPLLDEQISSPLQVFGQAKKQINSIFIDVQNYVAEASECMTGNIIIKLYLIITYKFKIRIIVR